MPLLTLMFKNKQSAINIVCPTAAGEGLADLFDSLSVCATLPVRGTRFANDNTAACPFQGQNIYCSPCAEAMIADTRLADEISSMCHTPAYRRQATKVTINRGHNTVKTTFCSVQYRDARLQRKPDLSFLLPLLIGLGCRMQLTAWLKRHEGRPGVAQGALAEQIVNVPVTSKRTGEANAYEVIGRNFRRSSYTLAAGAGGIRL